MVSKHKIATAEEKSHLLVQMLAQQREIWALQGEDAEADVGDSVDEDEYAFHTRVRLEALGALEEGRQMLNANGDYDVHVDQILREYGESKYDSSHLADADSTESDAYGDIDSPRCTFDYASVREAARTQQAVSDALLADPRV